MARSTHAKRCQRFREKVRAHGYRQINLWVPPEAVEFIKIEARRLNLSHQAIMGALIEVGLRHLTPSQIAAVDKRWHEIVGYPIGPPWPGAKCDPSKRASKEFLAEGRRIRKEKLRAKRAA